MDQNAWARHLGYTEAPVPEIIAFYGLARHHDLRLLCRLKVADFLKSGFHHEIQREMTVADIVERMGGHGAGHLKQIEELKSMAKAQRKT